MGFWMKDKVEELRKEGYFPFVALFKWTPEQNDDAHQRFDRFDNTPSGLLWHTGINDATVQGYYLKSKDILELGFVVIGQVKTEEGLEDFCSNVIYNNSIEATFYHRVEALNLKKVHPRKP